jgi:Fe2+ transport system protein FeoA
MEISLAELKPGEVGTIIRLTGSMSIKKRIADMGLTPGAKIEMIRSAPMGDPVEFTLRGYLLTLRKDEAESVIIAKEEP